MKEVLIDGEIGYDWWTDSGITAKGIKDQLAGLTPSEDISISINSPGGSAYEGFVIFNLIRDYAKSHPVSVKINSMAMSVASYIALAARSVDKAAKVTASDNSIFMIHNPYGSARGDYRDFKRMADYFEKLSAAYGSVHAVVSGKTDLEIRAAMDAETIYVGKEIQDAGFANDFEMLAETETETDGISASARDNIIINAKFTSNKIIEKEQEAILKNPAAYRGDLEKAVALFKITPKPPASSSEKAGEKITVNLGGSMSPEELMAKDKALYDAVFALGEKAGLEKERARVNAHLLLGEKSGSLVLAAKHIKAGVSTGDETAQAEYFAAKLDGKHLADRGSDNPPEVHTGGEDGGGADDAKLEAAFSAGFSGKDLGGKAWE